MDNNKTYQKLFADFPPVSTEDWESRIIEDLKGADYDKKLVWKTPEGIKIKPYYRAGQLTDLPHIGSQPGSYPFVRSNKTVDNKWRICQDVDVSDLQEANRIALDAIAKGANALALDVSEVKSVADLVTLLRGIPLAKTEIHYYNSNNYPVLINHLIEACKELNFDPKSLQGSFDFDLISYLLLHGDFFLSESADFDQAYELISVGRSKTPQLRLLSVNGHYIHDSGANIIQELAFALASASEYTALLSTRGLPVDDIAQRIILILSAGSNYFMEIAKFRAIRLLWARMIEQYKPSDTKTLMAHVQVITSNWNKTVYDSYVNLLRSTTEAMAAAIGGVDSITVIPFDVPYKEADDFSRRIARNQQILLQEEAYLDKVIDPSAGSYYIEQLTYSIANHAWDLFTKVETLGGMTQAVKSGFIQDEVEKNAKQRIEDLACRRMVLLGTNQHPDLKERMLEKIQEAQPDEEERQKKESKYKTLHPGRLSDEFEDLRLATEIFIETGNDQPVVFLFTIGNLAMRIARATFSTGFFGCAGYRIVDNAGFTTVEEGIEEVRKQQPSIVVICSSDEEYVDLVPQICKQLKEIESKAIPVLAGYPKEHVESFKQAGIEEFIHIRSNVFTTLIGFHKNLGIID